MVFTGGDGSAHPSVSITHGGPGNDVILSDFRHPTLAEYFYGDEGSDLLWPNPLRLNPLGNVVFGGGGRDAIILLNGLRDSATMGDLADSVKIPIGKFCSVSVPLPEPLATGGKGKLSCTLPIDVRIPGILEGLDLDVGVDTSGHATADVSVKPGPGLEQAQQIMALARGAFPTEICICDPKLPGWASLLGDDQR